MRSGSNKTGANYCSIHIDLLTNCPTPLLSLLHWFFEQNRSTRYLLING